MLSHHYPQLHCLNYHRGTSDHPPPSRLLPPLHQLHGRCTVHCYHYIREQLSAAMSSELAVATRCPVHIPQLDKLHLISERAAGGWHIRCHVPGYHQDICENSANGYSFGVSIWTAFLHVAECSGDYCKYGILWGFPSLVILPFFPSRILDSSAAVCHIPLLPAQDSLHDDWGTGNWSNILQHSLSSHVSRHHLPSLDCFPHHNAHSSTESPCEIAFKTTKHISTQHPRASNSPTAIYNTLIELTTACVVHSHYILPGLTAVVSILLWCQCSKHNYFVVLLYILHRLGWLLMTSRGSKKKLPWRKKHCR